MIEDTVKAVRAAEEAAKDRIAKAREEAEALLDTARTEADTMIAEAEKQAAEDRAAAERKAEEDGGKLLEFSGYEAERDISALRQAAGAKEESAIETVLRELF